MAHTSKIDDMIDVIIDTYKTAWERQDDSLLTGIFSDDAIYIEKPNHTFRGISDIQRYWRENAIRQKNVTFMPVRVIKAENEVVFEWEANFFRVDINLWMNLKGVMWLYIHEGRISELREYFFSSTNSSNSSRL